MRTRWRWIAAALAVAVIGQPGAAVRAQECAGRAGALGTSRVIAIDPNEHRRIGSIQYRTTLPLAHKEVVLTFDDGPLPTYTSRVLDILAAECVKATFFIVGRMARAYPEWVRRLYNAGHTVASHTDRHTQPFDRLDLPGAITEIDDGIAQVQAALGDKRALAPFFRFPGLRATRPVEKYLAGRGIMTWSADAHGDDWRPIAADEVVARMLRRLEAKGRGVLLLHDIQARTVLALPELLRELRARGYRVVHVVSAGGHRPKQLREPELLVARQSAVAAWPVAAAPVPVPIPDLPAPSALSFGFPNLFGPEVEIPGKDGAAGSTTQLLADNLLMPGAGPSVSPSSEWLASPAISFDAGREPEMSALGPESLDASQPIDFARSLWSRNAPVVVEAWSELRGRLPDAAAAPAGGDRRPKIRPRPKRRSEPPDAWALRLNWFH